MRKYTILNPDPMLQRNLMAFDFQCGEGWYPLIWDMLDKIQDIVDETGIDLEVTEIKEKYGALNIYLSSYTNEIFDIVREAENKSTSICEICGKEGKLVKVGYWWMTRCDKCLEKEK
jgi:hypothetical protein